MDKNFIEKLADGLETVALYEGVVVMPKKDFESGEWIELDNEDECDVAVGGEEYDMHLALFTFCKLLRDGKVSVECNDVECKDWKYLCKLLGEKKERFKTIKSEWGTISCEILEGKDDYWISVNSIADFLGRKRVGFFVNHYVKKGNVKKRYDCEFFVDKKGFFEIMDNIPEGLAREIERMVIKELNWDRTVN